MNGEDARPPPLLPGGFWLNVLPVFAWALGIFYGASGGPAHPPVDMPFGFDKFEHAGAFLGLQFLSYRALRFGLPDWGKASLRAWGAAASVFAGIALEIYQAGLPDRSAEVQDVIADAVGATLGVVALKLLA